MKELLKQAFHAENRNKQSWIIFSSEERLVSTEGRSKVSFPEERVKKRPVP